MINVCDAHFSKKLVNFQELHFLKKCEQLMEGVKKLLTLFLNHIMVDVHVTRTW